MANIVSYHPRTMDQLVNRMLSPVGGVPIKTVQSFLSKIPSVFTGAEVIEWVQQEVGQSAGETIDQAESIHLCHMIAAHGYMFPIDDHILTVKNDGTYYRFQTKCFWLSRCHEADNNDYAVYLCKRALHNKGRASVAYYEAENLEKLNKTISPSNWNYICIKAEAQLKVDKKREKFERKILDSQEKAFWDLHRPGPGCINTTEVDKRKWNRIKPKELPHVIQGCPETNKGTKEESLRGQIKFLKQQIERRRQKLSKALESLIGYWEMYSEFDPVLTTPEQGNPWLTDSTEYWESDKSNTTVPRCRYKRWVFSILELLKDPAGRQEFHRFLHKEVSAENLEFWLACRNLKTISSSEIKTKVAEIYVEYLADGAKNAINVDAQVAEKVKQSVIANPSRYTFDSAEEHIFNLMKNDSYTRFTRSDHYKDYVSSMAAAASRVRSSGNKLSLFGGAKPMLMLTNTPSNS